MGPRSRIAALLLVGASAGVYLWGLDRVPPFLSLDEAHFGVHAHSIAQTGRNLNGDLMPLFVSLADPLGDQPALSWGQTWYHPTLFYLIAATLQVLPFSEAAIRVPSALLGGVINVALMYALAFRLTGRRWTAAAAAALLAFSPAHLILSRQALDYTLPLPFVLTWLWCLVAYSQEGRARHACAAGLALGAGCFSYVTSWVYMPMFLALSWWAWAAGGRPARQAIAASAAGFALPLVLLLAPWVATHPGMPTEVIGQYGVSDGSTESAMQALAAGKATGEVARRTLSVYWSYFDPSFLFVFGGASRNVSTGQAGVFLLSVAALLPAGLWALARGQVARPMAVVLVAGLLTAPMLAALKGTPFAIQRATALLPFVSLVAALGLAALWVSPRRWARPAAAALVALALWQFVGFYVDYQTAYQIRSGHSYDPTAFAGVADYLLDEGAAADAPAIYITAPLYDVSAKWRFHLTKRDRLPLLARTRYFDGNLATLSPPALPGGVAVVEPGAPFTLAAVASGEWRLERVVHNLSGEPTLSILRRAQ